jgi:Uma2 family endonuclease
MNLPLRRPMTLDQFLAWEQRQDLRYEFDGVDVTAMVGGTMAHGLIAANVVGLLHQRLRGKPCRVLPSDAKVVTRTSSRYPDVVVACPPLAMAETRVANPVVVFEVLSDGTAGTDRIAKNEEYRGLPSIRRYVMLEQTTAAATVFAREGGDWIGRVVSSPDAVLSMPEIEVELRLAEVYEGIEFPAQEPEADTP